MLPDSIQKIINEGEYQAFENGIIAAGETGNLELIADRLFAAVCELPAAEAAALTRLAQNYFPDTEF